MVNTPSDDLVNHNLSKPIIRTMENDLRSLKSGRAPSQVAAKDFAAPPKNLPIDLSKSPLAKPSQGQPAVPRPRIPEPVGREEFFKKPKQREESAVSYPGSPAVQKPLEKKAEKIPEAKFVAPPESPFFKPPVAAEPPRPSMIKAEPMPPAGPAIPGTEPRFFLPEEENLPPSARLAAQSFSSDFGFKKAAESNGSRLNKDAARLDRYEIVSSGQKPAAVSGFGRVLKYIMAIAVLAVVSYGVYYLAALKKTSSESPGELLVAGAMELNLNTNLDSQVAAEIKRYFSALDGGSAGASKPGGAYRLVIKNSDGSKILKAENFKNALGLDFPAAVLGVLDKNYNLLAFDYPQKKHLRLGFVFKIKDAGSLSRELAAWEPSMFKNLEPLFLDATAFSNVDIAGGFRSNAYKGAGIRYLPLGSADAALNYAVDGNKKFFLVATSKDDILFLIDAVTR